MTDLTFAVSLHFLLNLAHLKVEYHSNENPLKHSDKIAYIGQRLMYPIIKKLIPYHASLKKNDITFLGFYIKNGSF